MTKLLNAVATRIQTRLSRKGLKVTLGEIKDYLKVNVSDVETISDSDVNIATDYFMNNATSLTVIDNNLDNGIDNLDNNLDNGIDNLDDGIDDGSAIATKDDHDYPEQSRAGEITHTPQSQLITTTADQMGIVLDAREISLIAENINSSSDDFEQDIDAIKSAIMAFINHKALVNQSKINEMINEVREVVGTKSQQNSQLLSDGLRNINSDIQEANKLFKSNVSTALAAFTIPAIKAG